MSHSLLVEAIKVLGAFERVKKSRVEVCCFGLVLEHKCHLAALDELHWVPVVINKREKRTEVR